MALTHKRARQLASVLLLVRVLHRNRRSNSCQGPTVAFFTAVPWLGVINVYKFPLYNFHVQDPSTIIMSEMPTESLRIIYSVLNN
jgi:hypothetical protein